MAEANYDDEKWRTAAAVQSDNRINVPLTAKCVKRYVLRKNLQ